MRALIRGYVYIMVHSEDHIQRDQLNLAWQRSVRRHALHLARDDPTPRVLHVRRDASWTHYDCMRDAAVAAGFHYEDVFCGHVERARTVKLPGETLRQTTLDE